MTPYEMFGIEPEGLRQLVMTFTRPPAVPVLLDEHVRCGCICEPDGGLNRLVICEGHARQLA